MHSEVLYWRPQSLRASNMKSFFRSGAAKACVIVHDQKLVAYVTGEKVGSGTLRAETTKLLPPYMVPSAVVVLEAIPTTGNGKVDKKALPPPPKTTVSDGEAVAPRNDTEAAIAAVLWAEAGATRPPRRGRLPGRG